MPVQKGKKRKRERRRGAHPVAPVGAETENSPAGSGDRKKVMRRGWTPPLWVNATVGLGMLLLGTYFTVAPPKGESANTRFLLGIGYCVIAGFYLARAYRQYRARRQE